RNARGKFSSGFDVLIQQMTNETGACIALEISKFLIFGIKLHAIGAGKGELYPFYLKSFTYLWRLEISIWAWRHQPIRLLLLRPMSPRMVREVQNTCRSGGLTHHGHTGDVACSVTCKSKSIPWLLSEINYRCWKPIMLKQSVGLIDGTSEVILLTQAFCQNI